MTERVNERGESIDSRFYEDIINFTDNLLESPEDLKRGIGQTLSDQLENTEKVVS